MNDRAANHPHPRVYLETYGCQMNVADSQTVSAVLRRAGYVSADGIEDADVILLNTCAIREHAEERVLGRLGDLARIKHARPEVKIGLLGCMAQHNRVAIMEKAAFLDVVAGPDSYRRLPEMIGRAGYNYDPSIDVRLDRAETYADITPDYGGGVRAYVTAMRGCDKFCAFCVVPYVRGRERSIPPSDLMREIGELAARGVKEVVLLGQTVNAYRFADTGFGALLKMVASIGGIERIRFTSPHPSDMSESVIEAMATEPKVQPHLHLPLQSGSDRILAAMERGYTVADYLGLVARVRAAIPAIALSTDIIVGFHGEQESDFEATTAVMRAVGYDSAFMFKYSVREHTRAFRLGDSVSEEEKGRRLSALIALQEEMSMARNRAMVGREFPVLVEGPARRGGGMMAGKTPQFKTAIFAADEGIRAGDTVAGVQRVRAGDTVNVRVDSATGHSLMCSLTARSRRL
ncbi:MAG: tRNA (N6-isopentenyl adenosine(37)-C2)-methylthiotransferase MiaB [Candidatus Binatus sp.]|jgi:tRNA-2-methylthio-N6-dimethylallyladenosine synthase|uniref:tRNA (N6-isopentenyl adenosine(37)-C2)-methylthiotransferase MiaB n=2 Tax=Candidatus Binatus sp. TaxID=2811406 RepID=UPI003BB9C385